MNTESFKLRFLPLVVAAICAGGAGGALAQIAAGALPTGGTVVGGQASIVQNGTTLNINQTTNQALVNFSTFNVGSGALVDIRQPGAAAALLARVTGGDPSQIYGQIRANGALWLINPSGILVGQGARIDVGSFIASTLGVSDTDFLAGRLNFTSPANGGGAGAVRNAGTINAASGGSIYLVAPKVENSGMLNAPKGEVILAAAQNVQLIDTGHPGVTVELTGTKGDVNNLGRIVADAGRIGLAAGLVTNAGTVSASSAESVGGRVFLRATDLKTTSTSDISANGTSGGNVVLSADNTNIDGRISATGSNGPGGFLDTSGHLSLNVKHAPIVGKGGEWLIDPSNLVVVAGGGGADLNNGGVVTSTETGTTVGADVITAQLNQGTSVSLVTGAGGAGVGNIVVNAAIAKTAGDYARLTLRAHNDVTVNAPITSTSGALDLDLKNNFFGGTSEGGHVATVNANVNLNGGRLDVSQGEALGNGTLNITGGTTTLGAGSSINAASVNVQTGGRVSIDSEQTLKGAWNNAGQIDIVNNGSINLVNPMEPATSLTNTGRITLSGSNGFALTGATDGGSLINNGDIVKTSTGAQQITGLTNGPTGRLIVDAGKLTLDQSTLGGHATVAPSSTLVLSDSNVAGGVDIIGAGAMVWSGNVTLLGDVTLGATAPTLSDDPGRFFTFIRGSGYKLTTYGLVNVVKNLVLDSGATWENFGTVTVGPASPSVLAFNLSAVFNNKSGGVVDVRDGSRLELATTTVINNEAGALLKVDSTGTGAFSGGNQGQLLNAGTLVKTGSGTTPAPLTNLAGGVLKIEGGSFGVAFTQANANAGTIEIASSATLLSNNGVDLYNAGTIRGTGTININGEGGKLVNNGVVAPGGSDQIGTLTLNGQYTQGPMGALNIRLADATSDQFNVNGAVQLAGAVNVSTLRGGMPTNGAVADFLVASSGRTGTFSQVNTTPVVTPETTGTLSVIYPASGSTVAQVKATTAPTTPVVTTPVVTTPVTPVVEQPVSICSIAPDSALCIVLSPPSPSKPVVPVLQVMNEVIKTVAPNAYANLEPQTAQGISTSVAQEVAAANDKTGTKNEPVKKMYCN
ncbi:filamentous hemagglutinin N-terminal domain-containing protein [Variovorax sp. LG9.2]|uniref:two-partner secretion domain-containing protein n=1 Tax=Variovorax sp. LG9.2 TaxID=3048626 RepID=UPI002B23A653|nr:filamentous hemagglutinin N-terminal domain-containing protein [Variovorax sp. LG9.2]MEB0056776.1 filamentous hemagglutinin N-terminal domain-containing protein [Variovorax sp. LG9.2]